MKALVFLTDPDDWTPPDPHDPRMLRLAQAPVGLRDLPEPEPLADDWLVLQTRLCGVCGSDTKQMLMDGADESADNAMTAFISFPQVLGHEVVATVGQAGARVEPRLASGRRVVLNPWLSCGPRGVAPPCPPCAAGDFSLCWSFLDGRLTPGIHSGNSSDATGGFAERLPAHESMVIPVPDDVTDEAAVLADPCSVSLHAITRNPPPPDAKVMVYGAGALGLTTVAVLAALRPDVEVMVVAAHQAQADLAARWGATVMAHEPRETLVEAAAAWSGGVLRRPWKGLPVAHPGHIDVVYDTVGSPETLEVAVRLVSARGKVVVTGVSPPGRFEWTPLYFKEVSIVGSNAFGQEVVDGVRRHAFEHYFDLVRAGRIDLTPMLTHRFPLDRWRDAFVALADQDTSGAIKVAFDFR